MQIIFKGHAYSEFQYWSEKNKQISKKILSLLEDIKTHPYHGIGKPEPLKYDLAGYWSRRITKEHRLVYKIEDSKIVILSCRYHY